MHGIETTNCCAICEHVSRGGKTDARCDLHKTWTTAYMVCPKFEKSKRKLGRERIIKRAQVRMARIAKLYDEHGSAEIDTEHFIYKLFPTGIQITRRTTTGVLYTPRQYLDSRMDIVDSHLDTIEYHLLEGK